MHGAETEGERDEPQSVAGHRTVERLDGERSRQRLGGEPVRRGDHAVRRGQQARAPVAEVRPHLHGPRQAVVHARLGDDAQHRVGERLADHHREHRPPQRQTTVDDGEGAEHVHDGVEEEREVDREEVAPPRGLLLLRNRLDAVFLDRRHYVPREWRRKKSATTRLCSSVASKIVEWFEPEITCFSAPRMPS